MPAGRYLDRAGHGRRDVLPGSRIRRRAEEMSLEQADDRLSDPVVVERQGERERLRRLVPIAVERVAVAENDRQLAGLVRRIEMHLALVAVDVEVPVSRGQR